MGLFSNIKSKLKDPNESHLRTELKSIICGTALIGLEQEQNIIQYSNY